MVAAKRPAEQLVHRVVSSATWPGAQIAAFSRSHSPLPAAGILPIEQFTHSEEPAGATKVEMQLRHCDLFVCAMAVEKVPGSHVPRHISADARPTLVENRPAAHGAHAASEGSPTFPFAWRPALHSPVHCSALEMPGVLLHFPNAHGAHVASVVLPRAPLHRPALHIAHCSVEARPVRLLQRPTSHCPVHEGASVDLPVVLVVSNSPAAHSLHMSSALRPVALLHLPRLQRPAQSSFAVSPVAVPNLPSLQRPLHCESEVKAICVPYLP